MMEDDFGALIVEQVAIPTVAAISVGGFVAFLVALYVVVKSLRDAEVSLAMYTAPQLVCLGVAVACAGTHRFNSGEALALYGVALPVFLVFFPALVVQAVLLAPEAFRGVRRRDATWRTGLPALLIGVVAAVMTMAGGSQLGASGELAQFHERVGFNYFNGGRAVLYVVAGVLLYSASLRPIETAADVRRLRGLSLGVALAVVVGEYAGAGVGTYAMAMFMDSLTGVNAIVKVEYMSGLLAVELAWGVATCFAVLLLWAVFVRRLEPTKDGQLVAWQGGDWIVVGVSVGLVATLALGAMGFEDYKLVYATIVGS